MEVGVSISQGALGSLLKKLTYLLADECARLKGVRREIRFLRSELNNMNAVLQKCSMLENPDIQVKVWTKEVRELAYDIEDCIDLFMDGVGTEKHHGPGGIKEFFRKSARRLKTLGTRHHIANQIKELKARVIEVSEQRVRYKLDEVASSNSSKLAIDPRLSALFVEEAHLVGIEFPRDDLVNWLVEGEIGSVKHRKVLSIFGFGGLGKTTLANEVSRKIGKQFGYQAFVSVSQKPDMKRILCDIVPQLTREDDFVKQRETWDEKRLIEMLREFLQLKRWKRDPKGSTHFASAVLAWLRWKRDPKGSTHFASAVLAWLRYLWQERMGGSRCWKARTTSHYLCNCYLVSHKNK